MTRASRYFVEALHRHQLNGGPSLRVVGVERHAIAEIVQSNGERRGRRPLLLVHRLARRTRLGRGARDVEEEEHGEIPPAAKALDVDRLVRR